MPRRSESENNQPPGQPHGVESRPSEDQPAGEARRRLINELAALKWQLISELAAPAGESSLQIYQALWSEMIDAGLSIQQLGVLTLLAQRPVRVSDIAARLHISAPSTTGLLNRLEKKGLIERYHEPSDRRTVMCRLTSLGEGWVAFLTTNVTQRIDQIVNALSIQQIETLLDALRIMQSEGGEKEPAA